MLGVTGPRTHCEVVFDCRAAGGYIFAGHTTTEATRADLLAVAGLVHRFDIDVRIPSLRGALPEHQPAQLVTGALVSFTPRGISPQRFAPLQTCCVALTYGTGKPIYLSPSSRRSGF